MKSAGFSRALLKISGEILGHPEKLQAFLDDISQLSDVMSFVIVTGGGNFFRGRTQPFKKVPAAYADRTGMCASITNALFLSNHLKERSLKTTVFTPMPIPGITLAFQEENALDLLGQKHILILGGGLGLPFITTDTAAVLTALRTSCDLLIKATQVSGVFSDDPAKNPKARLIKSLSYQDIRQKNLTPLDSAALALAETHGLPMRIFCFQTKNDLIHVLEGKNVFSHIT